MGLENIDFSFPPEPSSKRPLESDAPNASEADSKRLRMETSGGQTEDSLEDGLALLVQNALSNVGDLVGQFDTPADIPTTTDDVMDLDAVAGLELPKPSPTFFEDPLKYIKHNQSHALASLVS